jgi:hypothetical protein
MWQQILKQEPKGTKRTGKTFKKMDKSIIKDCAGTDQEDQRLTTEEQYEFLCNIVAKREQDKLLSVTASYTLVQ